MDAGAAAQPGLHGEAPELHMGGDRWAQKAPQLQALSKAAPCTQAAPGTPGSTRPGPQTVCGRGRNGLPSPAHPARLTRHSLPSTVKQRSTSFWLLTTRGLDDSTGTQICSKGQKTDTSHRGRLLPPRAAPAGREGHALLHSPGPKRPSGLVPSACPTAGIGVCRRRSLQHPLGATQTRTPKIQGCFRDLSLCPCGWLGGQQTHSWPPMRQGS